MSRHEIPPENHVEPKAKQAIIVGWDPPLMTYFFQVYYDGRVVVWLGADPHTRMYQIETLKREIAPYAVLTPDLLQTLYADRDEGR